jgi:hypothetical protein
MPSKVETSLAIPLLKIRDSSTALGMTKKALTRHDVHRSDGFGLCVERRRRRAAEQVVQISVHFRLDGVSP